jgi:hypothetical protein
LPHHQIRAVHPSIKPQQNPTAETPNTQQKQLRVPISLTKPLKAGFIILNQAGMHFER